MDYCTEKVNQRYGEFENSELYRAVEEGSDESLDEALSLLAGNKVDIHLTSNSDDTKGWTYLHYITDRSADFLII